MIVEREEMLNAMDTLGNVPSRPGIASSEFIQFQNSKGRIRMMLASEVMGYSEARGEGKWPFKETIYIDRRLFDPFINSAKEIRSKSPFKFIHSGKKELMVINGSRKAKFTCSEPKQGYATIGRLGKREIKVEPTLSSMLLAARQCAENQTYSPELGCIFLKRKGKYLQLYSTTGVLVFKATIKSKLKLKEPLPFPLYIVELMGKDTLKGIEVTNREVILDFGNGKVWQPVPVKAKSKFPATKIDGQIHKQTRIAYLCAITQPNRFGRLFTRMAGYLSSVRRLDWTLRLKGKKGESRIDLIVSLGHTVFRDRVKTIGKVKADFDVLWPLDRLLGIITSLANSQESLEIRLDEKNRGYVKTDEIDLLIARADT